jgi:hypothetical protein
VEFSAAEISKVVTTDERRTRQVGDPVIELQPDDDDGHHLKLCSLSAEANGLLSEMMINLSDVRPLACALLDAAADLTGLVVNEQD